MAPKGTVLIIGGSEDRGRENKPDMADKNKEYEQKFGYIFIVCATGKSAGEMLSLLNRRMSNDPTEEIKIAAAEQNKITQLRLEKLFA